MSTVTQLRVLKAWRGSSRLEGLKSRACALCSQNRLRAASEAWLDLTQVVCSNFLAGSEGKLAISHNGDVVVEGHKMLAI